MFSLWSTGLCNEVGLNIGVSLHNQVITTLYLFHAYKSDSINLLELAASILCGNSA